jgi:hypothetical protein
MASWHNFSDENLDKIPEEPGVYKIRWFHKGKPKPIARLAGIDWEGILYIGSVSAKKSASSAYSVGLRGRLYDFRNSAVGRNKYHIAGKTYNYFGFSRIIPLEGLQFQVFYQLENPRCTKTYAKSKVESVEHAELRKYLRKFRDKPPLNFSMARFDANNEQLV